jgi:hypothetical protein
VVDADGSSNETADLSRMGAKSQRNFAHESAA